MKISTNDKKRSIDTPFNNLEVRGLKALDCFVRVFWFYLCYGFSVLLLCGGRESKNSKGRGRDIYGGTRSRVTEQELKFYSLSIGR